jgi:hypothetical protein
MELPEGSGTTEGMGDGSFSGGGGAIERQRPINVTVDIRDNEIAGEDGFRELAQIIRTQFDQMGVLNS